MQQPNLGQRVAELRQQKGLTQEQLADDCEVSTRTIQRIENGEAEPRAFTRNNLSKILEFDFGGETNEENDRFWLALLHLSCMFVIVFIPLLIWSWKKEKNYTINQQGRDVLNFQITMTLGLFTGVVLIMLNIPLIAFLDNAGVSGGVLGSLTIFSILPMIGIGIFCTYQAIVNTIRALSEKPYRYPLSIHFIK